MNRTSITKNLLLLSTFLLFLTACGPSPDELAFQTQEAATAAAANWTETPTLTPTATFTSTPTLTPTSTFTPTPTQTPTITLTPSPTPFAGGGNVAYSLWSYVETKNYNSPSFFLYNFAEEKLTKIADNDGLEDSYLGDTPFDIKFSPDGKFLALGAMNVYRNGHQISNNRIFIYDTEDKEIYRLDDADFEWGFGWSLDGNYFYFSKKGVYHYLIIDTNDWNSRITFDSNMILGDQVNKTWFESCMIFSSAGEWCLTSYDLNWEDGDNRDKITQVIFEESGETTEMVLVEVDSDEKDLAGFDLSPDETEIVYGVCSWPRCSIYLLDLNTGTSIRLPIGSNTRATYPVFSPDGKHVLYMYETPSRTSWYIIYGLETGKEIELKPDEEINMVGRPAWGP